MTPWFTITEGNYNMIMCTEHLFCSEYDRKLWLAKRDFVKAIMEIQKNITVPYRIM